MSSTDPVNNSDVQSTPPSSNEFMQQSQTQSLESVFQALFSKPFTGSARDAVQLLSGKATHIASMSANPDQCLSYLKATALHVHNLMEILHGPHIYCSEGDHVLNENSTDTDALSHGHDSEQRLVSDVVQAAGCAVTQCRHRSDISKSGIIPVLAQLALSCQKTQLPPTYSASTIQTRIPANQRYGEQTKLSSEIMDKQSQTTHVLTAAHTELLQACISAGHYTYACQFTDRYPVLSVQPYKVKSSITAEQYLRYFYLLGMARLGLRRYHDAKLAFEICLTMPSHVISAVTIECRKKHLLVKCLLLENEGEDLEQSPSSTEQGMERGRGSLEEEFDSPEATKRGKSGDSMKSESRGNLQNMKDDVFHLPKSCSPAVVQYFKNNSGTSYAPDSTPGSASGDTWFSIGAEERISGGFYNSNSSKNPQMFNKKIQQLSTYRELANEFIHGNCDRFDKIKRLMESALKSDGNWGLVNQVQELMNLPQRLNRIVTLYEEIPFSKLAKKLGLKDAEEAEAFVRKTLMEQENMYYSPSKDKGSRPIFKAIIDQEEGIVHFPLRDRASTVEFEPQNEQLDLARRIKQCMELTERMQNLDIALSTSHKYNGEFNATLKYRTGVVGTRSGSGV